MNQNSDTLRQEDVSVIKLLLHLGFQHKRIAALFDVNQGRISEINSGAKWGNVNMINVDPPEQPYEYPLKKKGKDF